MINLQTLSDIRTFILDQAANGTSNAIRDRAEEVLRIFNELDFATWQTDYAAANNGLKLRLLGELQSALLGRQITNSAENRGNDTAMGGNDDTATDRGKVDKG